MRTGLFLATLLILAPAASAAAASDLVLAKRDSTPLTEGNVGSPYWSLQAQCAGMFGASYAYRVATGKNADVDKATGSAMLQAALGQLQSDRGIDRAAAVELVKPEVEYGRAKARRMLNAEGADAYSIWNTARSTCLDIADGHRRRNASSSG